MNIKIPIELWFDILKYTTIVDISNLACANNFFYEMIRQNKWRFIDNLIEKKFDYIPKTNQTYINYKYCIDWSSLILAYPNNKTIIPNNVIEWIDDRQDLEYICIYQYLCEETIRKVFDKINWRLFLTYQILPLDLICYIVETYDLSHNDWRLVWSNPNLDIEFIIKYVDFAQWHAISSNKDIVSLELINHFGDRLNLHELTKHGIHESIVTHYLYKMDFICWANVSQFTQLSMDFIKTHIDKLNLQFVLNYQNIDEKYLQTLIERFEPDESYFQYIALNQKLSYDFIIKYKNMLPLKNLVRNKKILRNDICKIFKK